MQRTGCTWKRRYEGTGVNLRNQNRREDMTDTTGGVQFGEEETVNIKFKAFERNDGSWRR